MILMQISRSGYVSFQSPLSASVQIFSSQFPFTEIVIAPYWTEFLGLPLYRVSTDKRDLYQMISIVSSVNSDYCDFQPIAMLVVTWADTRAQFIPGINEVSHYYVQPA